MSDFKLVVFDVDGTLIDSQHHIIVAMQIAFDECGIVPPDPGDIRAQIGLSLDEIMPRLAPEHDADQLVDAYKRAFVALRHAGDQRELSALYPGARKVLHDLAARDDVMLGVATGKSMRGLDHVFDLHDIGSLFHTVQVSDHHPSKPHPSMLFAALSETGIDPECCLMIGDTSFDMQMAANASVAPVGVDWGYHPAEHLRAHGARSVLTEFSALLPHVENLGAET